MNQIKELLMKKQETLKAKLKESSAIKHPTGNGDCSENGWKSFLKQMLPKKYGIDKGYVIDYEGNVSDQIDIIIYDALYSPFVMLSESNEKYIPVESVYAIVEVKPTIEKRYLEYANKKIESVKKLKRSNRAMICAGKKTEKRKLTRILGILLATSTNISKKVTLQKHLNVYKNIDIGCAIDKYSFISHKKSCGEIEVNITKENEAVLGLYFYLNNELYKIGTVAGMDIRKYANTLDSFDFNTEEDFEDDV